MNKTLIALLLLSPIIVNASQTKETYACKFDKVLAMDKRNGKWVDAQLGKVSTEKPFSLIWEGNKLIHAGQDYNLFIPKISTKGLQCEKDSMHPNIFTCYSNTEIFTFDKVKGIGGFADVGRTAHDGPWYGEAPSIKAISCTKI